MVYNNEAVAAPTSGGVVEDDVVASIMLDDPNAFDRCCFDQNLFENLIQTPVKQEPVTTPLKNNTLMLNYNSESTATDANISMLISGKIRTPTPLKNAMAKIRLKEEQRERLRVKSVALHTEFCDSGYLSFNENLNQNQNQNHGSAVLLAPVALTRTVLNVNNPILIGKTNDQLNLTEKARCLINNSSNNNTNNTNNTNNEPNTISISNSQFTFLTFNCTSTPLQ